MTSTLASPTTIVRGESFRDESIENGESPVAPVYRTRKCFAVVHFQEPGKGLIVFLPEMAEVRVIGPSCIGKCVEILFENRRYNIFNADLLGPCCTPLQPSRVKPVRALSVACA
jgi:hypothetical protein